MSVTVVQSGEARTRWRDLLDSVFRGDREVVIKRYGKPVAALISYEIFETLQAVIAEMHSAESPQNQISAEATARLHWSALSEASLMRLWDNEQDAVYDDWEALYGVSEG